MVCHDDEEASIGSDHGRHHNAKENKRREVLRESVHECDNPKDENPHVHGSWGSTGEEEHSEDGDEDKGSRIEEVPPKEIQRENGSR